MEDQPLPNDSSLIALSLYYVGDSDSEEDPEEDPEEDHVDYPADGGDDDDDESYNDDDESFDDDDDDDDDEDEEEEHEDYKDDDKEEEEHPALADSFTVPVNASRMSIQPQTSMSATAEALIAEYAYAPTLPSPPQSPLSPLSSPLSHIPSPPLPLPSLPTTSPTYAEAPLGYKAARIRLRVARESSAVAAARQPGLDVGTMDATPGRPISREVGYGIEDVWDNMVRDMEEKAPTTVEGLSQRVIDLSTTLTRDTHEIYVRLEDVQDDRSLQRGRVNTLFRDKRYHLRIAVLTQLTIALGRIQTLEAREPKMSSKKRTTIASTTPAPMTDAQLKALIAQGVADALA
ncbi:hypothetical protein Tco_0588312 [Tanacetum coccineum]